MCLPAKTWITGLAPGVSKTGMVVDPLNLSGAFGDYSPLGSKVKQAEQPAPADERAKAEADAAQRANAALAETNRRRREQSSLLAKGAPVTPQFSFGDTSGGPSNVLDATGLTTRNTTARTASLMSLGAPAGQAVSSYGRGGASTKFASMAQ